MADEKKVGPLSEVDFARLLYHTSAGCSQREAVAAYRVVLDALAAETARADGTERETIAKVVAWLRTVPILIGLTHRNCADAIERGDWRPK